MERRRLDRRLSVSATKIETFYRGYSFRKSLFEERLSKTPEEDRENDIAPQVISALKIQYFFRHDVSSKRLTVDLVFVKPPAEEVVCEIKVVVSMTAHLTVQNEPDDKDQETPQE